MKALALIAGVAIMGGCAAPGVGVASADPNSPEVAKLFEQYDCDRNGLLTYEEVKDAEVGARTPGGEVETFKKFSRAVMDAYNNDENGGLDKTEAAKMWLAMRGFLVHVRTDGGCR